MGKKCNVFNFKYQESHNEVVIQVSELTNKPLTIEDVDTALRNLIVQLADSSINNAEGYKGSFEVPIEK